MRARNLKSELHALALAYEDPRTPIVARIAALAVAVYALSPIDLIPDPIPVLGYLDDLILLPVGIWLALRLIPPFVLVDSRERARRGERSALTSSPVTSVVIVFLWIAAIVTTVWLMLSWF